MQHTKSSLYRRSTSHAHLKAPARLRVAHAPAVDRVGRADAGQIRHPNGAERKVQQALLDVDVVVACLVQRQGGFVVP